MYGAGYDVGGLQAEPAAGLEALVNAAQVGHPPDPPAGHAGGASPLPPPAAAPSLTPRSKGARGICRKHPCDKEGLKDRRRFEQKPEKRHLCAELKRRVPDMQCDNWNNDKLLLELSRRDAEPAEQAELAPAAAGAVLPAPAPAPDVVQLMDDDGDPVVSVRWAQNKHTIRLVHVLIETKVDFLNRDKTLSREQLDAAPRNWYWEKANRMFMDPNFRPVLDKSTDPEHQHLFDNAKLRTNCRYNNCDADKCKREFVALKGRLSKYLANFRKSGMGDMPDSEPGTDDGSGAGEPAAMTENFIPLTEAEKVEKSHSVFSSKFAPYCRLAGGGADIVALYAYEQFLKHQLLASAASDLPKDTEHSSETDRSCAGDIPQHLRGNAHPGGGGRRGKASEMNILADAVSKGFSAPVLTVKSADEQACDHFKAGGLQIEAQRALLAWENDIIEQLTKVETLISESQQKGAAVPPFLLQRRKALLERLDDTETQGKVLKRKFEPTLPVASLASLARGNSHASASQSHSTPSAGWGSAHSNSSNHYPRRASKGRQHLEDEEEDEEDEDDEDDEEEGEGEDET